MSDNRQAQVLFKGEVAGTLEETAGGGTRFTYNAGWRQQIGCALPVDRREHEWGDGLHPFFQHIAPEGWLRENQARAAHIEDQDDFGLLLRYGADCIGAVSVLPVDDTGLGSAPSQGSENSASPSRTISGVQRKALVIKDGDAYRSAPSTGPAPFIAKFNSHDERVGSIVRNEALTLRWSAVVLGTKDVNDFTTARVEDIGEHALIVTRFDRTEAGEKLRLEDFAQILAKPRRRDFGGKYDASYEEAAAVITTHSVRPAIDLARFFRRVVVFALVGNCDGHLKNFSLLETGDGLRLSPAYDIVNTALYDGFDQNLALSIAGAKRSLDDVSRELLQKFGEDIGLNRRAVEREFVQITLSVRRASALIKPPEAEPPDGFIHRYSEIVRRACLRILGE
jgi:serine/threonine-protein kinase HipA